MLRCVWYTVVRCRTLRRGSLSRLSWTGLVSLGTLRAGRTVAERRTHTEKELENNFMGKPSPVACLEGPLPNSQLVVARLMRLVPRSRGV